MPLTIAAMLLCAGCADALLSPEPGDSPPQVAQAMWTDVDQYYSFFGVNKIDWGSIGGEYLPRVTTATSDSDLFDVLGIMLSKLKDGHATLDAPGRHYEYDGWYQDYPANYSSAFIDAYLGPGERTAAGGGVVWGRLGTMGYLGISTFDRQGIAAAVDTALAALGDSLPGLIVDVRSNGGGSEAQARAVAGHFARQRVLYAYHRYKSGPGHDDFGPSIPDYLEPSGRHRYYGPIAVLTNRGVYSAAEDFVLAMRALPRVTTVGDTTGGGSGNPIARELPNGWIVHVPRWQLWGVGGTFFEGVGLAPDVPVQITDADKVQVRDTILERAWIILLYEAGGS
jgi:hypothetical protein